MNIQRIILSSICTLVFSTSAFAADTMIFASEIIRHGDRTPHLALPTAPYDWPEGIGELTAIGMQQEYQLGVSMRKTYVLEAKLLPKNYHFDDVYVRSSDFDRTLVSAQSVLMGLYPLGTGPKLASGEYALPEGYQPIPIHTIPVEQDDLLVAHDTKRDQFEELVKKYVYPTNKWKQENAELEPQFKRWSKILGIQINNLGDVFDIGDNLYVRKLHDAPMPEGLTQEDIDQLIHWSAVVQAEEYAPKQIGALTGKDILIAEKNNMVDIINGKSQHKFVLYSGHDISLLAFLSAIGAPVSINPPYTSHISIQLFKTDKEDYYFLVLLNDKAVNIPGCQDSNRCTLDQIDAIINDL